MRRAGRIAPLVPLLLLVVLDGCDPEDGRPCYPGDYRWCQCDGVTGFEQCGVDGEGYGACDCSGVVPGAPLVADAGADAPVDVCDRDAGPIGFLCPCTMNSDCESGICHAYVEKGQLCTLSCAGGETCPSPSPGCNMMGICKAP